MPDKLVEEQVQQFCNRLHSLNRVYEDFARSVDVPYTTLEILNYITQIEECTQKVLCERTFLPKQTVNNVVTSFYKQGLVELRELPSDRRNKTIHLTEKGKKYAEQFIPQVHKAECEAMQKLPTEQRKNLLEGMKAYCDLFQQVMPTGQKEQI